MAHLSARPTRGESTVSRTFCPSETLLMRFYKPTTKYCCGIDLHKRNLYACVVDRDGQIHRHRSMRSKDRELLSVIEPFRGDVTVSVECTFSWYFLDLLLNPDYASDILEAQNLISLGQIMDFLLKIDFTLFALRRNLNVNLLVSSLFSSVLEQSHV